jgi:hypothetical protein
MPSQPSQRLFFDFWALMPKIEAGIADDVANGYLTLTSQIDVDCQMPEPFSLLRSYQARFEFPANDQDYATCVLTFENYTPYVILLVGTPDGLRRYRWKGFCPCTRKLFQLLKYDDATRLFVSAEAHGRRLNPARERGDELSSIVDKVKEKYGSFDPGDFKTFPFIEGDRDLPGVSDLRELLHVDAVWINSGLPRAVFSGNGQIDVLATIREADTRYHYPRALLVRNKHLRVRPKFKDMKEMLERMRERRIPIPQHLKEQAAKLLGTNFRRR